MTILAAWLLADLLTGVIHWYQDHFLNGTSKFAFLNGISADNDLHHAQPYAFLKHSLWQNMNTSAYVAWPLCVLLISINAPHVITLTLFFASFGNIIHRWGHMHRTELPWPIVLMKKTGLFLTTKQHYAHHYQGFKLIKKEDTTRAYCVMTTWLNPVLDEIGIFPFLQRVLK